MVQRQGNVGAIKTTTTPFGAQSQSPNCVIDTGLFEAIVSIQRRLTQFYLNCLPYAAFECVILRAKKFYFAGIH